MANANYDIEVQREKHTIISRFTSVETSEEMIKDYLQDINTAIQTFQAERIDNIYHILVIASTSFRFGSTLQALTTVRRNTDLIDAYKSPDILTMIVSASRDAAHFIEKMLGQSSYGGQKIAVFSTVEAATAFIARDRGEGV
jgi:hypothetical protein